MVDRQNTIDNLEQNIRCIEEIECHQFPGWGNVTMAMRDAAELLKEQEPVKPIEMIDDFYPIGDPLRTIGWRCGKCGDRIAGYDNFCPNCGQAVKWDES